MQADRKGRAWEDYVQSRDAIGNERALETANHALSLPLRHGLTLIGCVAYKAQGSEVAHAPALVVTSIDGANHPLPECALSIFRYRPLSISPSSKAETFCRRATPISGITKHTIASRLACRARPTLHAAHLHPSGDSVMFGCHAFFGQWRLIHSTARP